MYCPVKQPIPATNFAEQLVMNLKSVNSDAQILKLLPNPAQDMVIAMSSSKYGEVSHGSPIAYQQRPQETTNVDIIQCPDAPPFPKFPLPEQPLYNTVLSKQLCDVYAGLEVDVAASLYFEQETLQQSKGSL